MDLLLNAVKENNVKEVIELLSHGANPNAREYLGEIITNENVSFKIAQYLVQYGADVNYIWDDVKKRSLLITIADYWDDEDYRMKNFEIAKILVSNSVNINYQDKFGNTALWYAVNSAWMDNRLLILLLENGADMHLINNIERYYDDVDNMSSYQAAIKLADKEIIGIFEKYNRI